MSSPPHNDTLQPGEFSGSAQTPASRPPASSRDVRASKRVCFYKSGDPQFSGHRIVINSRTFKTFDALLDALSKKVPLPFGVRTITTPKGTHAVRSLDDLRDGASYVCSDQRRVKPLNLDEVNRRQVPWNTTRPTSSGRQGRRGLIRQLVKRNEAVRTTKVFNRPVAVWTPKRLVVFKNRDPSTKHTVVLQRRTAPTFEALLDYLSQVLQFPVLKLYTADGRRVEGLPALILCSGIVVAAGNEPFRLGNYNFQGPSQPLQSAISESIGPAETQPLPQDERKSGGSRSRSRNFSLSSERYVVSQINKSLNGSLSEDNGQKTGSVHTENNPPLESEEIETGDFIADIEETDHFIMPSEDDIEKSFRVNQDGSMTVEMKVRLTLKQEEMIHWTTTLSRTCASSQQRAVCSQPGYSPDSNTYTAKEAKRYGNESKEENTPTDKSVTNEQGEDPCGSTTSETLNRPKPAFRRLPTPGPARVRRKAASVENIKRVSQNEVQESTVGAYSYVERTAEGELTEGYCVVSRSSSSSTRPVPKPRKNNSGETKHKKTHCSLRPSRTAEVLQLQNDGTEITETVMRIYESQGAYENYLANTQITGEKRLEFRAKTKECRNPDSTDSGPRSSSNDCDVDLTRQSTSSGSQNARKNELLSLSSGRSSPPQKINNNLSSGKSSEKQARPDSSHKGIVDLETCTKEKQKGKSTANRKTIVTPKSVERIRTSDTTVSEEKQKVSVTGSLKDLRKSKSPESQSHTGSEKKTVSSTESNKHKEKAKKKTKDKRGGSQKSQSPNFNFADQKGSSEKNLNLDDTTIQKSPKKVNIPDDNPPRSPVKKKLLDVLPSPQYKTLAKHKSMNECRTKSTRVSREVSESISMPVLQSASSNVHQYVENWLKKIQPESVPYMDELDPHEAETEAKAKFWIGSGSPDSSEIRSEPEKDSTVKECTSLEDSTTERTESRPSVQIRCEGDPVETQRIRGFCKSMPSVRIHHAEQESHIRMNKSTEALAPIQTDAQGETSQSTRVNTRSGMKPVLQQLCLSIQSIRRTSSHSCLTSLEKEKSSSLPDFSSQVASVFGAPSKALLSFLSVMTLKDDVNSASNKDPVANSGSYPEALQVMQSLEKLASIEDEEELKASLTSLRSSTSSQLKKSWRDFQERNDMEGSPPLSPRQSEQEFALEVDSEGEDQDKDHDFGIKELMDELNMPEDLRREISSLVDGEPTNSKTANLTNTATHVASENEDATTKDSVFCPGGGFKEDRGSDNDENIACVEKADVSEAAESEESCHPDPALRNKDVLMEKMDIVENVQTVENEAGQTGLVNHVLDEGDNTQTIEEKYTENATCQADELTAPDHTQNNLKEKEKQELRSHTSGTDSSGLAHQHSDDEEDYRNIGLDEHNINEEEGGVNVFNDKEKYELGENQQAELQTNAVIQEEDFRLNEEVSKSEEEEENSDTFKSEHAESLHQEPGMVNCDTESHKSCDSEAGNEKPTVESPCDEHDHNIATEELCRSESLKCSGDDADPDSNSLREEQGDKENEDTSSKRSEDDDPDAESHHSSVSDSEQADKTRTGSFTSQGSEGKHGLQTLERKDVLEKQICSAEEKDEGASDDALDSDKDFDAEPNYPAMSEQDSERSDREKKLSSKSQESEAEQVTLEEKEVTEEKDEESDEQEDKQSTMSESGEDLDGEPNSPAMSDQKSEHSEQNRPGSYRSPESEAEQELQTLEEEKITEEANEESDEQEDKQSNTTDSNEDSDAETNYPVTSHQKSEHPEPNRSGSCKSQESEDEQELQILQEEEATEEKDNDTNEQEDNKLSSKSQESEAEQVTLEEKQVTEEKDEESDEQEDKQSSASESGEDLDREPNSPAMSDQRSEHSEQNRSGSCKSQESEAEQELQTLEEEKMTEENDEESEEHEDNQSSAVDSNEDLDEVPNSPAMTDQKSEHSEQNRPGSRKSQESETEQELQTLEEKMCEENDEESEEHEDKQSSAVDSNEDLDEVPNSPAMSDQKSEHSEQNRPGSCKSQESEAEQELQTLEEEEEVTEQKDKDTDEHENEQSSAGEDFDEELNSPAMSDHDGERSDQDKSGSCKSQESEDEHDLYTVQENRSIEKQISPAEENNDKEDTQREDFDPAKDFDADPNYPATSDQEGEGSEQDKAPSCKSQELEEEDSEEKHGELNGHENNLGNSLDSDEDSDTEPNYSAVLDEDRKLFNHPKSQESEPEHKHHAQEQENINQENYEEHMDRHSNALDSDKDMEAESNHSHMPEPETKHPVGTESYNSQDREASIARSEDTEGVEDTDGCNCVYPMEISQELLDLVNFALLSSALTFTYDSNGQLRIKPDRCKVRGVSLTERSVINQDVQRRLPSPNTSDLSDYRPETSDSGGDTSQVSTDLFTEIGEEEVERLPFYQGAIKPSPKICKRRDKALDNRSTKTKSESDAKYTASSSLKSINSLASFHDSIANGIIQEPAYSSTSGSMNEHSEPFQRAVYHSEAGSGEGILIDKGRWLLKENHLIRKSPPVPMGMYENVDTTSVDTGQDNTSEDAPYPPCRSQHSQLAVISSSELEEMAKPPTPKCTYFNMLHSSDSDPFLDNQSTNSSKGGGDVRKSRDLKVSPMGETSKTWAKKNGSLPSFASVEFKLPDGKVHPEAGLASGAVEKTARSQSISSKAAQEEESVEGLNLRCGRHCPIL
ncbi:hypothetical protein NFI96_027799 [Prochilodus magdalenae]|nr:hypothetical protein NFI96_027799 [Prochilodus magdalenae]